MKKSTVSLKQLTAASIVLPLTNLQFFGAGNNNNSDVVSYQLQFKELLKAVYNKQAYFSDFFVGGLEALDGVKHNSKAFTVKTSDIPVAVGATYNKGANVAMGTGTSNTSRFGNRTEIKYVDTDVNYSWEWTIHEGIDRHTVNNDFNEAIADRLELQAKAKVQKFDAQHGAFINTVAGKTEGLTAYTAAGIEALFDALSAYYVNIEAVGEKIAKVKPSIYNLIIKHPLTTTAKNANVNIGTDEIKVFKGFEIHAVPETRFAEGVDAYVYVKGVGKAFTGINTARTKESEDFDGVALQGAGKAGEFILPDNKAAVVKVTSPVAQG